MLPLNVFFIDRSWFPSSCQLNHTHSLISPSQSVCQPVIWSMSLSLLLFVCLSHSFRRSAQRACCRKSGHSSLYFLAIGGRCTYESNVKLVNSLSRDTDGELNTKSLKAATPSGQEVNVRVPVSSVSSSLICIYVMGRSTQSRATITPCTVQLYITCLLCASGVAIRVRLRPTQICWQVPWIYVLQQCVLVVSCKTADVLKDYINLNPNTRSKPSSGVVATAVNLCTRGQHW